MDVAAILVYAAPVAIAAIGESVNQKAGQINIGLEGMMLTAAFAAMWVGTSGGGVELAIAGGVFAALLLTILQNALTIWMRADQVVVGAGINLLALGVTGTLFRARFGDSGKLLSVEKVSPILGADWVAWLVPMVALCTWFVLFRTQWGLAIRSAGEYPAAASAAGYSLTKLRLQAALFGGALAGLAGAYLTVGVTGSFTENMTAGRGFMAIAIVTFGRWNPLGAVLGALVIGYAESLQFFFQAKGLAVPHQLLIASPYLATLAVLILAGRGRGAPAALGKPLEGGGT